jgi:hypothetical protein
MGACEADEGIRGQLHDPAAAGHHWPRKASQLKHRAIAVTMAAIGSASRCGPNPFGYYLCAPVDEACDLFYYLLS